MLSALRLTYLTCWTMSDRNFECTKMGSIDDGAPMGFWGSGENGYLFLGSWGALVIILGDLGSKLIILGI